MRLRSSESKVTLKCVRCAKIKQRRVFKSFSRLSTVTASVSTKFRSCRRCRRIQGSDSAATKKGLGVQYLACGGSVSVVGGGVEF